MRTSATGTRLETGFTLLEMLVVIALLGVLMAVGAQAVFRHGGGLDRQAARLERRLQAARVEARSSGQPVTLPCEALAALARAEVRCAAAGRSLATLTFYPDGSASGGSLEVGSGGDVQRLSVDWLSGRVHHGE